MLLARTYFSECVIRLLSSQQLSGLRQNEIHLYRFQAFDAAQILS